MTLLHVINSDKSLPLNSMWENKFLEPLAKVGAALVWNLWENKNFKELKKNQLLNMIVLNFLFSNSMLLLVTSTTRTESFYFFLNFFLWPTSFEITYTVNKLGPCTLVPHYFRSFTKSPLWKSMLIKFGSEMLKSSSLGRFATQWEWRRN